MTDVVLPIDGVLWLANLPSRSVCDCSAVLWTRGKDTALVRLVFVRVRQSTWVILDIEADSYTHKSDPRVAER